MTGLHLDCLDCLDCLYDSFPRPCGSTSGLCCVLADSQSSCEVRLKREPKGAKRIDLLRTYEAIVAIIQPPFHDLLAPESHLPVGAVANMMLQPLLLLTRLLDSCYMWCIFKLLSHGRSTFCQSELTVAKTHVKNALATLIGPLKLAHLVDLNGFNIYERTAGRVSTQGSPKPSSTRIRPSAACGSCQQLRTVDLSQTKVSEILGSTLHTAHNYNNSAFTKTYEL